MEINGLAHVMLTPGNFQRSLPFYKKLLPSLGMVPLLDDGENIFYCIGGRTAVGIQRGDDDGQRFVQTRVGLHHLCFRARERADVDACHRLAVELGAKIIHPPEEASFAPGYYSVLFEDPDGIRIEMNHVPGKGWLAEQAKS